MTKFKATTRLPLCSKQELNEFVEQLIAGWEANERTHEEVHERCILLMADAASSKPMINGKAIYAKALGAKLRARGCFMEKAEEAKPEIDSTYL